MSSAGELRICGPEEIVRSAGVFTHNAFDSVCILPVAANDGHTFEVIARANPLPQPRVPQMWFRDHQRETQLQSIPWGIALCREDAYGVHIIRLPLLLRAKKSSNRKKDCESSDEELT